MDLASETIERLFLPYQAFSSSVTVGILVFIAAGLLFAKGLIVFLGWKGKLTEGTKQELNARWRSWIWLIIAIVTPILLGAAYAVAAVMVLSLLCYREYAVTVGLSKDRSINTIVCIGIAMLAFASLDHYDRLYFSLSSFGVGLIIVVAVLQDMPAGIIHRVALGVFGYALFGYSLGYLGLMTNSPQYRPLLLSVILAVELNDIFAYCCGKAFKGPKLLPATSPGKTISGAVGAAILTSLLVAALFHFLYKGTPVDQWWVLLSLGLLVSVLGQLGDLTLSAIKRDLGIKDFAQTIPGHGGLLDRFDSLVLVPPIVYHVLSLALGPIGIEQTTRIFTG